MFHNLILFVCFSHCVFSHQMTWCVHARKASVNVYIKHQKNCGRIVGASQNAATISKTCLMSPVQTGCVTVWMIIFCHSVGHQSDVVSVLSQTMFVLLWPQLLISVCNPLEELCKMTEKQMLCIVWISHVSPFTKIWTLLGLGGTRDLQHGCAAGEAQKLCDAIMSTWTRI